MPLRDIFRRTKPAEEVRHTFKSPDKFSFLGSPASSGMEVSETSALALTAVYSCVRIISESLAALPLITYRETEDGRRQATDLPIYSILRDQADPNLTSFMMIETIVSHACTYGNGYAYISRNNAGQVMGLTPLDPRYIDVKMTESGRVAYEITGGTVQGALTSEEVLHIRALGQVGLVGYSPIGLARETIGLGLAAEKYGAAYFGNSGTPSGILSVPGKMSDEAFQNLRRSWEKIHKGSGNSARVALLEAGIDFKPISITPNDAQFLETRRFQVAEIARIFRVPPSMLADLENAGSYGSIGELNRAFVVHTLTPWARRIESEIKSKLLPSAGDVYAEFSFDHLLRGDLETRFKAYQTGRQAGFLSANDIRAIENLDPLGEIGDKYLTPLNMEALTPNEEPDMPEEMRSLEIRAVEDDRSRVREQTSPAMLDTLERLARLGPRTSSRATTSDKPSLSFSRLWRLSLEVSPSRSKTNSTRKSGSNSQRRSLRTWLGDSRPVGLRDLSRLFAALGTSPTRSLAGRPDTPRTFWTMNSVGPKARLSWNSSGRPGSRRSDGDPQKTLGTVSPTRSSLWASPSSSKAIT